MSYMSAVKREVKMSTVATPTIDQNFPRNVFDQERALQEQIPVQEEVPDPLTFVIFGGTGDLAHRKLVPALYSLVSSKLMPKQYAIVGFGRSDQGNVEYREGLRASLQESGVQVQDSTWDDFAGRISYVQGRYDDEKSFSLLAETLNRIDKEEGTKNHRVFDLATPPVLCMPVIENLGKASLNRPSEAGGWVKLIMEKPFGQDLATARSLNHCVHNAFAENQVYRIDHYLGKETVQNIFVLRFINGIFEPIWNRNYVDHVQITVAESLGVERRGGYYDRAGAARDMMQSHLLQLLTLTAMEPPTTFAADKVRDEKVQVLNALRFASENDPLQSIVRGQYCRGMVDGRTLPGYHDEEGVAPDSKTETYIAAKVQVDNWRWAGIPFYVRTGKRLPKRVSEIAIQFRRAPHMFLPDGKAAHPPNNVLVLRIQPDDALALRIEVKEPGPGMHTRPVDMSFSYKEAFGGACPDAYQRLLLDAMRGDSTLFTRTDEVETAWAFVTPMVEEQQNSTADLSPYAAGSWGPAAADALLEQDGHCWRTP
jgi:glucose-6-phosphate 1-dehydrogenase